MLRLSAGCGKSALVDSLAAATGNTDMVRLQLDDQMDAKSLLGAYTCTAVPGEFAWQPGPLTQVEHIMIRALTANVCIKSLCIKSLHASCIRGMFSVQQCRWTRI